MNDNFKKNVDLKVVEDFGKEWQTFNQKDINNADLLAAFNQYFHLFPLHQLNSESVGFDMGCGSGRWAKFIAPKVKQLHCIDPSPLALEQAKNNLQSYSNCVFECNPVSEVQLADNSQDFGYCLGVLHHIPRTEEGLKSCASKLKNGAPFLLYLYYRFDNKPRWFKFIWNLADVLRKMVSKLPFKIKLFISQLIAIFIYYPLSRLSLALEKLGVDILNIPLSDYRNKPFYFLRTDALDRFGTKLEKRFTKVEIQKMMINAGFTDIIFSDSTPYWVVLGRKSSMGLDTI